MTTPAMPTIEQIRAQVEAAKLVAMAKFRRDWGVDKPSDLIPVLSVAIPQSKSPADAARIARAMLKVR